MSSTDEYECYHYDIVIIGAGPSAMGLLYGLLLPYTTKDESKPRQPPYTIAVIDRGDNSTGALHKSIHTRDPKRWGYAAFASKSSSVIYTRPQVGLHNRMIGVPVGKGIGGTSNINACLVCQPHIDDFEIPLSQSSIDDDTQTLWTADIMLSATRYIENVMDNNHVLTRRRNWLSHIDDTPTVCSEIALLVKSGTSENRPIRSNYYEALIQPLLEAYPHLDNSVTFHTSMFVERVLFSEESKEKSILKAQGVECSYKGSYGRTKYCRIDASHCVILCGGAIYSPALLLASGLGDSATLTKAGISPWKVSRTNKTEVKDSDTWKSVGKGLQDHVILPRFFLIRPMSWNYLRNIANSMRYTSIENSDQVSNFAINNTALDNTPRFIIHSHSSMSTMDGESKSTMSPQDYTFQLSINGVQGWVTRDIRGRYLLKVFDGSATPWLLPEMVFSTLYRPNIPMIILAYMLKMILQLFCIFYPIRYCIQHYTRLVAICLMSPKSKGSVTLSRKGNSAPSSSTFINRLSDFDIEIDPAYLLHPEDIECLKVGWNDCEEWISQRYSIEILPGIYKSLFQSHKDKRWITPYAADFANPFFHWSGTLSVKRRVVHDQDILEEEEMDYVLGNDLRVRGTMNLYVCCASAFPKPISVPTALSCAALGYILATRILSTKLMSLEKKEKVE